MTALIILGASILAAYIVSFAVTPLVAAVLKAIDRAVPRRGQLSPPQNLADLPLKPLGIPLYGVHSALGTSTAWHSHVSSKPQPIKALAFCQFAVAVSLALPAGSPHGAIESASPMSVEIATIGNQSAAAKPSWRSQH
jgi:hypothetical protein